MIRIVRGGAARHILFAVALAAMMNCGRNVPIARLDGTGSVALALTLGSNSPIDSVDYMITGSAPGITGTIDVSNANAARTLVLHVPVGKGYLVELSGMSTDGKTSCAGMTKLDVLEGQTTDAIVVMQCTGPDATATGSVTIHGTFDNCPVLTSRVVMPGSAAVGDQVSLKATGADLDDGDVLTFSWTATSAIGSFDSDDVAQTMFTCTSPGTTVLTASVSDGTCDDHGTVSVTCLSSPGPDGGAQPDAGIQVDASPGTGGVAGTGGAGTGGAGGAGGSAVSACDQCTAENCVPFTHNGCTLISDASDKLLCENLYACLVDPVNACIVQGDPRMCWCGTNLATCYTATAAPAAANGPCLSQLLLAGKAPDTATVQLRLIDPNYPAGRAVNLAICRSSFCSMECSIP